MTSHVSVTECKYGKNCPFGVVCKFRHDMSKKLSKPKKAKAAVTAHVAKVTSSLKSEKITPMRLDDSTLKALQDTAVMHYARNIREAKLAITALQIEKKAYDAKYQMVDAKGLPQDPFADKIRILQMDLDAQNSAVKGVLGKMNNYRVKLSSAVNFASTVTSGITSGSSSLIGASYADFAALAGLFEEYKMEQGNFRFSMGCELATASTTPANTGLVGLSLGYSINSTAYGSTGAAADDALAKVYCPVAINASGRFLVQPKCGFYDYHFRIQPQVLSGTAVVNNGTWLSTSDNTTPWGYIKVYTILASATAIANAINGILFMEFHFRNRV